jgi:hypothetical protein
MEHFIVATGAYVGGTTRRSRQPANFAQRLITRAGTTGYAVSSVGYHQDRGWKCAPGSSELSGDDLMKCLECSFVGCALVLFLPSPVHILQHLLLSITNLVRGAMALNFFPWDSCCTSITTTRFVTFLCFFFVSSGHVWPKSHSLLL